jgi:hypothetical protein
MAGRELARSPASRRDQLLASVRLPSEATWCPSTEGPKLSHRERHFGRLRTQPRTGQRRSATASSAAAPGQWAHPNLAGGHLPKSPPGRNWRSGKTGDPRPRCILIIRRRRYRGSSSRTIIRRGPCRHLADPARLTCHTGALAGRQGHGTRRRKLLMTVSTTAAVAFMPSPTPRRPKTTGQPRGGARRTRGASFPCDRQPA